MKTKIQKVKDGSFVGDDGKDVKYFWVTATREGQNGPIRFQFGTRNDYTAEVGKELELPLFQEESAKGKLIWKEDTAGLGA